VRLVLALLIAAVVFLVSRAALCQEPGWHAAGGVAVSVGAGVTDFAEADMREVTEPGGAWEVRLAAGTRLPIAFEAAYVGSAQAIDAAGLDRDAVLVGTGLEGGFRLDVLPDEVNPYFLAAIGWSRYELAGVESNTSSVDRRDDVLTLPFGVGVDVKVAPFVLDARAVMRPTFDNELLPDRAEAGNPTRLDSMSLLLRAGVEL
jgi:hypothetical protein